MDISPADLLIRNARLPTSEEPVDLAIRSGSIAAIGRELRGEAVEIVDAEGALACGGFVDSHIHLDKACILDRCRICEGTLAEAVRETARAKASFTEADVYARAARVVEQAIMQGTMAMRSFVEVDPRAGLRSFEAIKRVRRDYAFAIDIEICAFVQEGLTNEPETLGLLKEALADGADLVGGAPYTDPDPAGQISLIFDLAQAHGVAVDFHLDFDLAPEKSNLPVVLKETMRRGWQGRVSLGHMTSLSARPPHEVEAIAAGLREAGIAVVALPATDLFLNGREYERLVPRGVAPAHILASRGVNASIATNNILNPFTPFGDASLLRMANLYANVIQLSRTEHLRLVFDMIGPLAARGMQRVSGLSVGAAADIVLIDCVTPEQAIRENSRVIRGWKRGRTTFRTTRPEIIRRG
ncbi:amidohydrolase [Labrys okinawensis]|uniref:Amidohydrolase n=1 Tax=Labrys okinawensis TaxID=346911 RepID=A0A2S9Q977_9HYPH|nr:amidohydrolase family protein [Labrys okinawensis]PRH85912.1 amidohydrolase [Labrys okinawensis]